MKKMTMRTLGAAAFSLSALSLAAQGWEYTAEVPTTNYVASGAQTQSGRTIFGSDQRVYKTGAGEWVLPYSLLDVYWPFTVKVAGGAVQVGMEANAGTDPGAFNLPASITDKALIWVDAADPQASHIAGDGDDVTTWYDRREGADVSSPRYFYAYADAEKSPGGSPAKGTYDGRDGVYFGGVGSDKCLVWYKPGGTQAGYTKGIRHFFAVTGVSNSWGCIYGSIDGNGSSWITGDHTSSDLSTKTVPYFWNNNWSYSVNSRCFRNGERLDPLENVQRGVQLIDTSSGEAFMFSGAAAVFFKERTIAGRTGGDYLFEAICFTNLLTEAELGQVRAYLMRKWQIAGRKDARVKLAAGTELVADATDGVITNGANVAGSGTFVKKGANDLVYRNFGGVSVEGRANGAVDALGGTRFDGVIDVQGGAVAMMSQAAVATSAGKRISKASAFKCMRPTLTTSSAATGVLVKDGAGEVVINGVPAGTRRLSVEGGLLGIRNVATNQLAAAGDVFEVPIANHSFEEGTDEEFADGGIAVLTTGTHGWYGSDDRRVRIVHMSKWTGNCAVMDNTTRNNWNFYSNPPDGDGALVIHSGYAETDVTLPSAGWYEMSCRMGGREGYVRNDVFTAQLVGSETVDMGRALYYYSGLGGSFASPSGYEKVVLKGYVATPGAYKLRINRSPTVSGNVTLIFDDFHLRRLAEPVPDTVPVPGGTFETVALSTAKTRDELQAFSADATVDGWTFAAPSGWTDTKPAAGVTTPRIKGQYAQGEWYNDSRGPGHGFAEAFFRAPTTATTSFTAAEAGTFRVQADLACFHSAGGSMQLTATVNGVAHDLGTLTPKHKLMRTLQWPVRLTLAAGDAVTLTFTFTRTGSNAGMWMDDVCLARRCIPVEGNLVKNGGFEQGRDNQSWTHTSWSVSKGQVLRGNYDSTLSDQIAAFGQECLEGERFARFQGITANDTTKTPTFMYQDIEFPREGVYRLSFYTHCRLNAGSATYTCPTKWWLAANGVTNLIIRSANDTKGYVEHAADSYVPNAGTFRLGIVADQASANYYDAMLDGVSVTHVGDLLPANGFDKNMRIDVAAGARLGICFAGTNRIDRLNLGGRSVTGIIDAKSHPDYIVGTGAFRVLPKGMIISFR